MLTLVDATPGGGLAAARREPLRLPRRRGLQVADLAARDGVDDGRARSASTSILPGARGLVRGRRRPTRPTSGRRCGWPTTRAGSTPPPPGSRGSAALPALELLDAVGVEAIHEHDVGLANRFRAGLGLEPGNSAIVSPVARRRGALRAAGIQAAQPGGQAAGRLPPLQRRRGRRPGGRRPLNVTSPKASPRWRREGELAPGRRNPFRSPRRRPPQPARARCAAASRASSAGTSSCRRAASSWPGAGSPGPAWRR